MNLKSKRKLASRVLNVGKNKIHFNINNLNEIKEAITKQDIRDLYSQGIILIKPVVGRLKLEKRNRRIGPGKTHMRVKNRKGLYVIMTRKLRNHLMEIRKQGKLTREDYLGMRKKIKMKDFKSKAHLKDYIENTKKGTKQKNKTGVQKHENRQEKKARK